MTSMPTRALARLVALSAVLLALTWVPQADARAARITLALPSSAEAAALVTATGRAGVPRGRQVVVQALIGGRWRRLATAVVSRHRFRATFIAPDIDGVLAVRAVLHRRR